MSYYKRLEDVVKNGTIAALREKDWDDRQQQSRESEARSREEWEDFCRLLGVSVETSQCYPEMESIEIRVKFNRWRFAGEKRDVWARIIADQIADIATSRLLSSDSYEAVKWLYKM